MAIVIFALYGSSFFTNWKAKIIVVLLFGIATGIGYGQMHRMLIRQTKQDQAWATYTYVCVQGEVEKKEHKANNYLYYLKNCYMAESNRKSDNIAELDSKNRRNVTSDTTAIQRAIVYLDADVCEIGQTLTVNGKIEVFEHARNEGNFDRYLFYRMQQISCAIRKPTVIGVHGRPDWIREKLYQYRETVKLVYRNYLSEKADGILETMILGDKSNLDLITKEQYRLAGMSHILSISGLHVAIIGMGIYRRLRKRGAGYYGAALCAAIMVILYGIMVGNGVSTRRAIAMLLLLFIGDCLGKAYDMLNALGLVAIVFLLENPGNLYMGGFQLSFAAVVAVAIATTIFPKKKIWQGITIWAMVLPLVMYQFYEVTLVGMGMNFIVLPTLGIVVIAGIMGGVTGTLHLTWLARLFLWVAEAGIRCYNAMTGVAKDLPLAHWICGQPAVGKILAFYGILGVGFYLGRCRRQLAWTKRGEAQIVVGETKYSFLRYFALGIGLLVLLFPAKAPTQVCVLDVGQGDGIFVRTSEEMNLFIDGGSSDIKNVGTYCILPFLKKKGITHMDYWFISHLDEDHISGFLELLEANYDIRCVVVSEATSKTPNYVEFAKRLMEHEIPVRIWRMGDGWQLGRDKVLCLNPSLADKEIASNDASLMLWIQLDEWSGIFMGDSTEIAEKELIQCWKDGKIKKIGVSSLQVDFYKCNHHGSNGSSCGEFIEGIKPKVTAISCGRENRYGHPHPETIKRFEMYAPEVEVYRTDQSGQITLWVGAGKVEEKCV